MTRSVLVSVVALLLACGDSGSSNSKKATDDDDADRPSKKSTSSAGATTSNSALPAAPLIATKFVRERPAEPSSVDACAFIGGMGFACVNALVAETDPVKQRYMRRMSDADAKQSFDAMMKGEPGGVAHAEIAMMCAEGGACKQKDPEGNELDDGYACLTKAQSMAFEKMPEAAAVHARACTCDPVRAQIPVMGGYLACDGPGKPVARGQSLTVEEAKDIRDCAECNHETGPLACTREIERLQKTDAEVAKYIRTTHVPRCAQP